MVIGANSTPTEISNLWCGEEGKFVQGKQLNCVMQHDCENTRAMKQLNSVTAQL